MQFCRIIKPAETSSMFAVATAIVFLLASGVAQAQCTFFTGFTDNKDGTVTDTRNGLIWKRCAEGFVFNNGVCTGNGVKVTWDVAKSMAQQSRFLDKDDWRLPAKDEFMAVLGNYEECKHNQNGEYAASKAVAHNNYQYWSSSHFPGDPDVALIFDFDDGYMGDSSLGDDYYVRFVRTGQVLGGDPALEFVNEITKKMRIETEHRRTGVLKAMSKNDVCVAYGKVLRGGKVDGIGSFPDMTTMVKKELARRKIKLDDTLILKGHIKLGISECQLYASWGMPEEQNRTVGGWGVHIQNIYGSGTYVYTENGKVTSWQD